MRKIILSIFIIAVIAVACNKKYIEQNKQFVTGIENTKEEKINFNGVDYIINNGMLNFETFNKYENLFNVDNPNKLQDFANKVYQSNAMNSYTENELTNEQKTDLSFIGAIVNNQGLIKIDEFTLLLNFDKNEIYATKSKTIQDLINAKNGNVISGIYKFSMENTDVIDNLIEIKTRGLFCGASWASTDSKASGNLLTTKTNGGGNQMSLSTSVRYRTIGIYYEIAVVSETPGQAGLNSSTLVPRNMQWSYNCKRRCGDYFSGNGNTSQTGANITYPYNTHVELLYSHVRGLSSYTVSSVLTSTASVVANASVAVSLSH